MKELRSTAGRPDGRGCDLLPLIEAEWAATGRATAELEAELSAALADILLRAERAVASRSMRTRIADAARQLQADAVAARRAALLAIAGQGGDELLVPALTAIA